jgi:hypothetical protein
LGPTEQVLPEDRDRIQSPKCRAFKEVTIKDNDHESHYFYRGMGFVPGPFKRVCICACSQFTFACLSTCEIETIGKGLNGLLMKFDIEDFYYNLSTNYAFG